MITNVKFIQKQNSFLIKYKSNHTDKNSLLYTKSTLYHIQVNEQYILYIITTFIILYRNAWRVLFILISKTVINGTAKYGIPKKNYS